MTQRLNGRAGAVLSLRITAEQRDLVEQLRKKIGGPSALGSWIRWAALDGKARRLLGITRTALGSTPPGGRGRTTGARDRDRTTPPAVSSGSTNSTTRRGSTPIKQRVILDLCAGSGAWSEPYKRAGYRVVRVTLPIGDVRTFKPPANVWGVLCAPPCTEFSPARNLNPRKARDLLHGLEVVNACMRIVLQCSPQWWALENPVGMLSKFLGSPRDVFEPHHFGDPWTKRTALWGSFTIPDRGPFVRPVKSWTRSNKTPDARAVTPPGFALAFFEANP